MTKRSAAALLALAAGCTPPGRPASPAATHPAGTMVVMSRLGARPYAAAVAPDGRALVGQVDREEVATALLPDTVFRPSYSVGSVPTDIAVDREGKTAFVANQFDQAV
ncbi:MAG TPA: hypothetical protein VHM30_20365 [Gemmatimonadaceae bacterium]|nr:hypothetical protein [Gemmatimonadaceae bacterium]